MIGGKFLNNYFGFFFHISGSANELALKKNIELAHKFIKILVLKILKQNGNLIVTFGDEQKKNSIALIFDYSILEAIEEFLILKLKGIRPIIRATLYSSYEKKMPLDRKDMYSNLKNYSNFQIKILPDLNSHGGNLRTEISKNADLLFILGGSKGVNDLVKKFTQQCKAIIPLNINLENPSTIKFIEMLNNGTSKVYPDSISSTVISEINKFSLTSESDIEESTEKILDLISLLIEGRGEIILDLILDAIISLQEKNRVIKPDEDKYSIFLVEILKRNLKPYGYFAHVQEISGKTPLGYNDKVVHGGMGELDIRIVDANYLPKHICEAFVLTYLDSMYVSKHLNKIFDYDVNGLPLNFIIVYSKANDFSSLWTEYLKFIKSFKWKYALLDEVIEDLSKLKALPAEIKISLTKHMREGIPCKLYHIFINLK